MSISLISLFTLPLVLATFSSPPPADRQIRHRDLASKHRLSSSVRTESSGPSVARNDHPTLGRRTLDVRAGQVPLGGFQEVGNSGVSAQMMFLGTAETVYILDKTENNPMTVNVQGKTRPAWGVSYDLATNVATPMGVTSNTFCAAGMSTADGSWLVFGGNQPVTKDGAAVNDKGVNPTGANPYGNTDGGQAIRQITPCDDGRCVWQEGTAALTMTSKRWYPTVEALGDGSLIILGGDTNGGYVSTYVQNNPTYEFWPKRGGQIKMDFLNDTVPMNLFPLTWLMPSGKLFMQAGYSTILYDIPSQTEYALPDMPHAQRTYPASGATVMLPLTPANNYQPAVLFCGGSDADLSKSTDVGVGFNITAVPADRSCVRIAPEGDGKYYDDDSLPEGRTMGNFVYLPDGKLWLGNGAGMGTAGYGDEKWSFGQSYAQMPLYTPVIYDPNAAAGKRFSRAGLSASSHERLYHSTAILLADGSLMISGSNPNKDVTTTKWGTSYVVERWYPKWYSSARPSATTAWPASLTYGGDSWDLKYTSPATGSDPGTAKVVLIRTGFSTHGMNFGQRYLDLGVTYTLMKSTGEVTLHVSQMPPNANIFQPGPAMIFLVVDGVPSTGQMIMIGSGSIGNQPLLQSTALPPSQVLVTQTSANGSTAVQASAAPPVTSKKSAATLTTPITALLGCFTLLSASIGFLLA